VLNGSRAERTSLGRYRERCELQDRRLSGTVAQQTTVSPCDVTLPPGRDIHSNTSSGQSAHIHPPTIEIDPMVTAL
jgi:hypothetical protein